MISNPKAVLHFFRLHAPWNLLCHYAEELNFRAPIQVITHLLHLSWFNNWDRVLSYCDNTCKLCLTFKHVTKTKNAHTLFPMQNNTALSKSKHKDNIMQLLWEFVLWALFVVVIQDNSGNNRGAHFMVRSAVFCKLLGRQQVHRFPC